MNLFELFVKIGVDDQASDKLKDIGGKLGNGLKTAAKIGAAAVGAASTAIVALTTQAVNSFAEYEQLAGGAQKIFDQMDYSKIATDANNAYKELGLSANQYLAVINDVGATFAATMGDEAGYEAAKIGLKAISDYASGTGKNVDELSSKFTLITRSTSSYQSIADQFSGILPATSAGFLKQAQAAGILSKKYMQLTQVPIAEYQDAVSKMLEQGVADLGLANNTMGEAFSTLSGSLAMAKGAWSNLVTGLADDSADLDMLIGNFVESVGAVATQIIPKIGTALNGASNLVRDLIPVIVQEIPVLIEKNLPVLSEAAVSIIKSLVDGISQNQGTLFETIFDVVTYLAESFVTMLPQIVELGLDLIVSLANGIAENTGELLPTIVDTIMAIGQALIENAPELINAGIELASAIMDGVLQQFEGLEPIIMAVVAAFGAYKAITLASEVASKAMAAAQWLVNAAMNANPIMLVVTLIAGLVAAIVTLWNTNEGFRDAVIGIWDGIKQAFVTAWEAIESAWSVVVSFFESVWDGIKGVFSDIGDWFGEKFTEGKEKANQAWSDAQSLFSQNWENVKAGYGAVGNWFSETFEQGKKAAAESWSDAKEVFSAIWNNIEDVFSKGAEIGANIISDIKEGISNAWDNLKTWFNNLWDSLFGNRTVDVDVNKHGSGSVSPNANGISYVPYDGYYSVLHEGERVLTAEENKAYNNGATGNTSGITIIQNIQAVPQTPVELAAATSAYFEQARWAF